MLGNKSVMVDAGEAVGIALKYATVSDVEIALKIVKEYNRQSNGKERDGLFNLCWTYAAIFEAGRMQGIREVRRKRRT